MENLGDKISSTGFKWSSLNAQSTETHLSHPFLGEPFSQFHSLGRLKIRMMENLGDKISSTGFKWSSLNAPSTEIQVSHPFWVNPFFSFPLSGVIRNWTSQYKDQDDGKFGWQNQLTGFKWSSLNAPCTETHLSHPFLGESLSLISTHWGNKELDFPV